MPPDIHLRGSASVEWFVADTFRIVVKCMNFTQELEIKCMNFTQELEKCMNLTQELDRGSASWLRNA